MSRSHSTPYIHTSVMGSHNISPNIKIHADTQHQPDNGETSAKRVKKCIQCQQVTQPIYVPTTVSHSDLNDVKESIENINENVSSLIKVNSNLVDMVCRLQNENRDLRNTIEQMETCITIINNNVLLLSETLHMHGIKLPDLRDPFH